MLIEIRLIVPYILSSELNHAYLEDPLHEGYGYDEERGLQGLGLLR